MLTPGLRLSELILGLCLANERQRYFVTMSLIGLGANLDSALGYVLDIISKYLFCPLIQRNLE